MFQMSPQLTTLVLLLLASHPAAAVAAVGDGTRPHQRQSLYHNVFFSELPQIMGRPSTSFVMVSYNHLCFLCFAYNLDSWKRNKIKFVHLMQIKWKWTMMRILFLKNTNVRYFYCRFWNYKFYSNYVKLSSNNVLSSWVESKVRTQMEKRIEYSHIHTDSCY